MVQSFKNQTDLAIDAVHLSKIYREGWIRRRHFKALNDVSFQVDTGSVFGLLGPNGAGKTTFVKTLLGIIRKTDGEARVFGCSAGSLQARRQIGYLPERLVLPGYLTGFQCLEYCGGLSGMSASAVRSKRDEVLDLVGLNGWGKSLVRKYSKGMMQRLGLAQAMLHQPRLLILDEPTDGLDPKARAGVREILHRLASQGVTIFLNSHLLQEVEQLCRDVTIMAEGTVRYCGPVDQVASFIDQQRGVTRGLEVQVSVSGDRSQLEAWQSGLPAPLSTSQLSINHQSDQTWDLRMSVDQQSEVDQMLDGLRANGLSVVSLTRTAVTLEESFLHLVGQEVTKGSKAMEQAGKRT